MALGEIYRVLLRFSQTTVEPFQSTAFYVKQDSSTGFDVNNMGDAVKAWWNTELNSSGMTTGMKGIYSSDVKLEAVTLRKWSPIEPSETTYTTGLPIAGGGSAGTSMPFQDSVILSLRTANIGRSYRGRMYLPAPSEAALNENFTVAAAEDIAQQTAYLLGTQIEGTLYDISAVVWSKKLSLATPITSVKVDQYLRSQRRRAHNPASYSSSSL